MNAEDAAWIAACRWFVRLASDPDLEIDSQAAIAFDRAGQDWERLGECLCGSGLARPLAGILNAPVLRRSVPETFLDTLSRRAMFDLVRERAQRDAIAQVGSALRELGGRGVLLKGSAFLMRAPARAVARATSDVDVLVEPDLAPVLRSRLLARGFEGPENAGPSAPHHLEPIAFHGAAIEIHTRMMPAFWGLPEASLLEDVRPVATSDDFGVPGPQALLFHSMVHASASFFSFGLKTAWDLLAVLRGEPAFDWSRLLPWSAAMGAPRAFWAPLGALTRALDVPVPPFFLERGPRDAGARRVEALARHRLFSSTEGLFDLDFLTKAGTTLLLLDRSSSRLRYVATALWWRASRPATWAAAAGRARRAHALRQAWWRYRRYRQSIRREADARRRP